jgi:hypothetical protein
VERELQGRHEASTHTQIGQSRVFIYIYIEYVCIHGAPLASISMLFAWRGLRALHFLAFCSPACLVGVSWMQTASIEIPALYHSEQIIIEASLPDLAIDVLLWYLVCETCMQWRRAGYLRSTWSPRGREAQHRGGQLCFSLAFLLAYFPHLFSDSYRKQGHTVCIR